MAGQIEVARLGLARGRAVEHRLAFLEHRPAQLAHVVDRHHHLEIELLAHAGVDDGDRAGLPVAATAEEAGDLVERALRGRQADALRRATRRRLVTSRSRRSSDRARWVPRLVAAMAWISSTITYSTEVRTSRAAEVSIR